MFQLVVDFLRAKNNANTMEIMRFFITTLAMIFSSLAFRDYIKWYINAEFLKEPHARKLLGVNLRVEVLVFTFALVLNLLSIVALLSPPNPHSPPYGTAALFSNGLQLFLAIIILAMKWYNRNSLNELKVELKQEKEYGRVDR